MAGLISKIPQYDAAANDALAQVDEINLEINSLLDAGDRLGAAKLQGQLKNAISLAEEANSVSNSKKELLRQKVKDGSILTDGIGDIDFKFPTSNEDVEKIVSNALSVSEGAPVNMGSGLGANERKNLAFILPENKQEYLEQKYPGRVKTISVFNSPVTMIQDDDGSFSPVDEMGFTGKDLIDAAGEIFPTIGSMVGATGGLVLQRSPLGASTGSAAGYTAAATIQDFVAGKLLGVEQKIGESVARRSTEAAIGFPIEFGITKVFTPVGRSVGKARVGETTERADIAQKSEDFLSSQGYKTSLGRFVSGSRKKQDKLISAAQRLPNWEVGQDLFFGAKRLEQFKNAATDGYKNLPKNLYDDAVKALEHDRDMFLKQVDISNDKITKIIRDDLDSEMLQRMRRPNIDESAAGDYLRSIVSGAKKSAESAKNSLYAPFYEKANSLVRVDPLELAARIEDGYLDPVTGKIKSGYFQGATRSPELERILSSLRARPQNQKRIEQIDRILLGNPKKEIADKLVREKKSLEALAGPLDASTMDDIFRQIRELSPVESIAGTGAPQTKRVAKEASTVAQQFRDDVYKKTGLYDEWSVAAKKMDEFSEYQQGLLGDILKMEGKKPAQTSRQILKTVYSDPENVRDVLSAVKRNDPQNYQQFALSLQESYLNGIGLNGKKKGFSGDFKFDEGVVKQLFGADNGIYGDKMVQKLNGLKQYFERQRLDASKITTNDVLNLSSAMSTNSINDITVEIGKRVLAQQQAERTARGILVKDALNGHRESIARGEFPAALFEATPSDVKRIFGKFNPTEQQQMRSDYAEYLFSKYPNDPDATVGRMSLWDGDRLLEDIKRSPKILENIKTVLGEPFGDQLVAASVLVGATRSAPAGMGARVTGVVTGDGVRAFAPVQSIISSLGDRTTGALYRAGSLVPLIRKMGTKELTEEQYIKESKKAIGRLLFTSQGIQALTETGKYDPEWSYRLGQMMGALSDKQSQFYQEFGTKSKPEAE